jgi:hypothetical protein
MLKDEIEEKNNYYNEKKKLIQIKLTHQTRGSGHMIEIIS